MDPVDADAPHVLTSDKLKICMRNFGDAPVFDLGWSAKNRQSIETLREEVRAQEFFTCGGFRPQRPIVGPGSLIPMTIKRTIDDAFDWTKSWVFD